MHKTAVAPESLLSSASAVRPTWGSAQPVSSLWTGDRECGSLEAVVAVYGAAAPEAAARLPVATAPHTHKEHPFVFFHQRKTGGSTIRTQMVYSAKKHSLSSWVPCSDKVPCESYYAPPHPPFYAVYGGHLYWASVQKALLRQQGIHVGGAATPQMHCFTVFREPVSRVASCWSYRMVEKKRRLGNGLDVKNVSAQQLSSHHTLQALATGMSHYGEGCNNEPLRILSDAGTNEERVNRLTAENGASCGAAGWSMDVVGALDRTLHRASRCVVGVLERCEETAEVLSHFAPWFEMSCGKHLNANPHSSALSEDARREILRQNAAEVAAYKEPRSPPSTLLFNAQLNTTWSSSHVGL